MNSDSTDNRAYSHKGLDSTANGQSTTEHGISSEPSARDRAGIGDFAFTEINKFNRRVHIECLGASDLQKYRDVITFITNDDSLLSNMGALRMARHMYTITDALATAQREAAGLRDLETWMRDRPDKHLRDGWIMFRDSSQQFVARCYTHDDIEAPTLAELVAKLTPAPEAGR